MFCIFSNIYICGINELNILNLSNFGYIINCCSKYNNLYNSPNFINLNDENLLVKNRLELYDTMYKWLETNFQSKIIILDETGLDNGMLICMYILMRAQNNQFNIVYENVNKIIKINEKSKYKFLFENEKEIIKNNFFLSNGLFTNQIQNPPIQKPIDTSRPMVFNN